MGDVRWAIAFQLEEERKASVAAIGPAGENLVKSACVTCDHGAHHNRAWAITYDLKVGREKYTKDKARRVAYLQHVRSLFDCLGVCRLPWAGLGLSLEVYREAYGAATGVNVSFDFLLKRSEAVYNLTRAISSLRGVGRRDDNLPPRFFEDSVPSGPLKGLKLSRAGFRRMLNAYYEVRGWGVKTGIPRRKKLVELGLKDVADKLEAVKLTGEA